MTFVRLCLILLYLLVSVAVNTAQVAPKLIVVVSFDQYRGDYPDMFRASIGPDGFAKIGREGATFSACFFEHANNITGPGHATLLTGCYPYRSGIVGNDFCDLRTNDCVYCASNNKGVAGAFQLETPTLGDFLRARDSRSKVIGVSLKDRAGILMAGASASVCVWYDAVVQKWTTSFAYRKPRWLSKLNRSIVASAYAGMRWTNEIPASESPAFDSVTAEGNFPGGGTTFPHNVLEVTNPNFIESVLLSPFSMDMVFDAATLVLQEEKLGKDASPDILCLGVSTTDYVGHVFGPNSLEVQELYRHADKRIASLISDLDARIGRSRYVLVITSDHGVAPIPEVVRNLPQQQGVQVDAGRIRESELTALIDSALTGAFGKRVSQSWVREINEPSVYLNQAATTGLDRADVLRVAVQALRKHPGLGIVTTRDTLALGDCPNDADAATCRYIRNSFHAARTGDIVIYPRRYWIIGGNKASHGTPHDYDRSVVLMLLGGGVRPQNSNVAVSPVDVAPTLAKMLGLDMGLIDGKLLPLMLK